ncbi:DgyrCDS4496 [Dimorphilus gyrociliatus]|uniref:DgyrCDS4496 n=1 Tax=Dimorphilus gyrociliatus TaxID=2664684 RepID=A0A7I8VJU0_9ANNE|nr:DgyrCDS4496 [Dimorphilus gyrociliatus]
MKFLVACILGLALLCEANSLRIKADKTTLYTGAFVPIEVIPTVTFPVPCMYNFAPAVMNMAGGGSRGQFYISGQTQKWVYNIVPHHGQVTLRMVCGLVERAEITFTFN